MLEFLASNSDPSLCHELDFHIGLAGSRKIAARDQRANSKLLDRRLKPSLNRPIYVSSTFQKNPYCNLRSVEVLEVNFSCATLKSSRIKGLVITYWRFTRQKCYVRHFPAAFRAVMVDGITLTRLHNLKSDFVKILEQVEGFPVVRKTRPSIQLARLVY